jgi:anti-sigma B factor antagonist
VAITLTTRLMGDVTVIDLAGRLTLGPGPAELRGVLQEAVAGGARKILLNLRELSFIDSAGLGEFAAGHTNAKQKGSALKIAGAPKRVRELFQMTGLSRVLDIHDDESEALSGWGVNPGG